MTAKRGQAAHAHDGSHDMNSTQTATFTIYWCEIPNSTFKSGQQFLDSYKQNHLNMKNFFKKILLAVIVVLLSTCGMQVIAQGNADGYLYVYPSDPTAYPNQQGGVSNLMLQNILSVHQVVSYVKSFPGAVRQQLQNAYEIHCDGDVGALKISLENTGLFEHIELEGYMQPASRPLLDCPEPCSNPQSINDPNSGYELTMPGYPCAWNITRGDPSLVVAVVDTDFDLANPDLQGQVIDKVGTPLSGCAHHGTVVAGIIVGKANNGIGVAGVAPDVKVVGYVVPTPGTCNAGCNGSPWSPTWQAYRDGLRIINVSWSGLGSSPTVVNAIKEMTENGTILILAAGNGDPGDIAHEAYSDIPGVLNVSSISSDGSLHEWVHYNQYVDLCAPGNGVGILTFECNGSTYTNASGTSLSAPNVAGAAALVLSVNPCLKASEVENILKTTTCPIINNQYPNWTGTGYLNAYAAVEKAKGFSGIISQSGTWSGENYVSADVIIPSGITLTINGTVKFSEGTGLIIQPGGRVNLYGTLTNGCMEPWEGVLVEGMANESQYTAGKHGRLYSYDGALIENAVTGVELVAGGIISATGTSFKNNGTGVAYFPYSNFWPFAGSQIGQPRNHFGGFNNCSFLADDDFDKAIALGAGMQMEGVRGIGINGCTFLNERTIKDPMGVDEYGYGIKATDSRFSIASLGIGNTFPPSSFDHSLFKGLGYGIYVGSAQTPNDNGTPSLPNDDFINVPYTVHQATFSECIYGIHNRFVSQGTIVGNTFNMGKLPPAGSLSGNTPFTNIQVGVFIENGANGFELQENHFVKVEDNVNFAYGTYCQNLGWFNNNVRRNTYTNVEVGNLADEDNAITGGSARGLRYLCNTNTTQDYDFYVFQDSDIHLNQGEEDFLPTGGVNRISAGNVFTKANAPVGDFRNLGTNVRYFHFGNPEKPVFHVGLTFLNVQIQNTCENSYCLPPCREQGEWTGIKAEFNTQKSLFQTAMADMQSALLSGNTALAQQKSDLASGYRLHLDELSNTLSLHMAFDTTTYNIDSVRVWWKKMESPLSSMVVARDYLAKGQNSAAFATLDAISASYSLSEEELVHLAEFRSVMQIMQGETIGSLSASKVQQLLNYATSGNGIGPAWAKNILTIKGYHFPPQPKQLNGNGERGQELQKPSEFKPEPYVVLPNPAKDHVKFERDHSQLNGIAVILTDATGRVVWQALPNNTSDSIVWNTADVKPGIYFYFIHDSNGLTQSGRIAVVK
jgi:hypothetical protein